MVDCVLLLYESLAATKPSKQVDVALHFLEFLLVTLGSLAIPLAVGLEFLTILRFSVELLSELVGGKTICSRWRSGDNLAEFV
jgi:hypothetical protein